MESMSSAAVTVRVTGLSSRPKASTSAAQTQAIRPRVMPMATVMAIHTRVTRILGMPKKPSPVRFRGRPFLAGCCRMGTASSWGCSAWKSSWKSWSSSVSSLGSSVGSSAPSSASEGRSKSSRKDRSVSSARGSVSSGKGSVSLERGSLSVSTVVSESRGRVKSGSMGSSSAASGAGSF